MVVINCWYFVVKKGLTERNLNIKMPGGTLKIEIDELWNLKMTGEVREIASGILPLGFVVDLFSSINTNPIVEVGKQGLEFFRPASMLIM